MDNNNIERKDFNILLSLHKEARNLGKYAIVFDKVGSCETYYKYNANTLDMSELKISFLMGKISKEDAIE